MKNFTFKKNVLLSATALSLALATNANAAINVQTGSTDITADVINAVVNNAEYAISAVEPDKASYTYTAPDGSQADLNTTQTAADYKADSAAAAYEGVSANADTVNYNDAEKTAANYTYVSYDADGNTSNVSGDTPVSVLEKGFTSSELAGSSTVTAKSDGSTGIDIASYKVSSGENVYTIQKDASTGEYTLYENGQPTDSYAGIKSELVAAYEADAASFAGLQEELAGYYNDSVSNYNDVATVVTADNNKIAELNTWETGYETANTNYGNDSAEYNEQSTIYDSSLSKVIDDKAKTAAESAVAGKADADSVYTKEEADAAIATAKGEANAYTDGKIADEVTARDAAIATAKGEANSYTDNQVSAEATRVDNILGKINHLADDVAIEDGKMNLDQGSSVSTHLRTLASSIGDRTQYTHEYNISSNESTAASIDKLDMAIGDLKSTGVEGASVAEQIKTLNSNSAATQASNEARFNHIENKIDDLQDEMREGLASTAALAGLVPLDNTYKTQLSVAMGGYKDKQAAALGAFHYLTDNIILNAGAAYNGSSNVAYKVGVTVGF